MHGEMDGIIKTVEAANEMKVTRLSLSYNTKNSVDFLQSINLNHYPHLEGKKDCVLNTLLSFESWSSS